MSFDEPTLRQITVDVCQSMLGLELTPLESDPGTADQLVASVEINGARNASVDVLAHENLMAAIAEAMFCSDRASLSQAEIRDAFGEIANMIGGNVKGAFGSQDELTLSLPKFGESSNFNWAADHCLRATFDCCGHPLTIVLRESLKTSNNAAELATVV